jgi:hypothetical protein
MTRSLFEARENLLQAATRPTWYDHLPKVEAAIANADRIADIRYAAGWDGDDGGWYGPHPVTGENIRECDWEESTGLPLPEDAA